MVTFKSINYYLNKQKCLLADRKDRQGFQSEILLNDQLQSKDFKYHDGYVVQDDIVSGSLGSLMVRNVIECLHQLSRTGLVIIFSIHQPRYSIFELFDTRFSIAAGCYVYHEPTNHV
ncbi:unnamed protein product [Rotaria sp. Silwood1]|nr:unnamed protein product [Rotaria sp. Silwood1]